MLAILTVATHWQNFSSGCDDPLVEQDAIVHCVSNRPDGSGSNGVNDHGSVPGLAETKEAAGRQAVSDPSVHRPDYFLNPSKRQGCESRLIGVLVRPAHAPIRRRSSDDLRYLSRTAGSARIR
jgi:hypothetical protein